MPHWTENKMPLHEALFYLSCLAVDLSKEVSQTHPDDGTVEAGRVAIEDVCDQVKRIHQEYRRNLMGEPQ